MNTFLTNLQYLASCKVRLIWVLRQFCRHQSRSAILTEEHYLYQISSTCFRTDAFLGHCHHKLHEIFGKMNTHSFLLVSKKVNYGENAHQKFTFWYFSTILICEHVKMLSLRWAECLLAWHPLYFNNELWYRNRKIVTYTEDINDYMVNSVRQKRFLKIAKKRTFTRVDLLIYQLIGIMLWFPQTRSLKFSKHKLNLDLKILPNNQEL